MARTIVLQGEPLSTQHIYGRGQLGRTFMTAAGKATKTGYQYEAKSQWKAEPARGPVALTVTFFFKNYRRRDLDNHNKIVLDALNSIVYEDDSQIDELHLYRKCDPKTPRIEVSIRLLGAV